MEFRRLFVFILFIFALGCLIDASAQSVVKQGNTFVQQKKSKESTPAKKTQYKYKTSDGKEYPIYISSKGKAYIIRVSKKTGKEYKQYLPEVTAQINK